MSRYEGKSEMLYRKYVNLDLFTEKKGSKEQEGAENT